LTQAGQLPGRLRAIIEQEYPRFSESEMRRRAGLMAALVQSTGVDLVLVCGEQRAGGGVGWLTGWPVTAEAIALFDPARTPVLFIQHYNHVPLAGRIAAQCEVRWGGTSTIDTLHAELSKRSSKKIGLIGPMSAAKLRRLGERFELVDCNAAYAELRLVKSAEELDWVRIAAWLSDLAIDALQREARSGIDERELWRICENAYAAQGGTTWIHYFGVTSMAEPDRCVPAQYPSARRVRKGDVMFCEISAQFWDYPGQVLRSFSIETDPTALYRDLYAVADEAFKCILKAIRKGAPASALVEASSVIEKAGFTTCDDLVHGFVGGYLAPVLGSASRPAGPVPDLVLEAGMTIVVQPNVVTRDGRAGVQVGELVLVTESGCETLHQAPMGFLRLGG
jgi:Xaa-Pro aminopeptidase